LDEGAAVVLSDVDEAALDGMVSELGKAYGRDRVRGIRTDVTDEASVQASFAYAVREFGGLDILVSNAGIASASPFEDTPIDLWSRALDILTTGYFLVSRAAFGLMRRQGRGGSIIFVGSKN